MLDVHKCKHEQFILRSKMGNVVQSGRYVQRQEKPGPALATVRAAGAFKAKLKQSKTATEQIEDILEWKFRRRQASARKPVRKLASVNELQEETKDNVEASKEVLKFVHR